MPEFWNPRIQALRFFCGKRRAGRLDALHLGAPELGRQVKVSTNRITSILKGERSITGDTALRLDHFYGTCGEFWLNLQTLYELRLAEQNAGDAIRHLPTLWREPKIQDSDAGGVLQTPAMAISW